MTKILCVEDNLETLAILGTVLRSYDLTLAQTYKEACTLLSSQDFSLLIVDIELPDGNGIELMASFSEKLAGTPVIFLTGKVDFTSKASAFSLGAEDFIVKPFDPRELKLRVDAKSRKLDIKNDERNILRIGNLACNIQEQRLAKNSGQEVVDLTSHEFRIFHLLAQTPNKIFSRSEILDRIWGNEVSVTDRAVDVHISNLRKKLIGTNVNIDAVIGSGYRVQITKDLAAEP